MRIIITLFISLFLIVPQFAFAGTKGVLEGKVTDQDGKPLRGAKVLVIGPSKTGAIVKKPDGYYVVPNLEAGTYEVTASFLGKGKLTKEIRISADQTLTINFELGDKSVTTEKVVVTASRIDKTKVGAVNVITQEDRDVVPTNSVNSFVAISAGVQSGGGGFQVRGSRADQTVQKVDGMETSSAFTGGAGRMGVNNYPTVSADATEEIQVNSGGQSAEHGGTLAGVINTTLKTGNTERFEGFFNYRTNIEALYGYQKSGLEFYEEAGSYYPVETGEGLKLQSNGLNQFEFGFGGPLGFLNSTFYLSGNNVFVEHANSLFSSGGEYNSSYRSNGSQYKVLDPDGNNIGLMDNNNLWRKNITARMKVNLSDELNIVLGGTWGNTNLEQGSWSWLYSTDEYNGIPENIAKQNVTNQDVLNVQTKLTHILKDINASYELSFKYSENNDFTTRRKGNEDPGYFDGFDIYDLQDNYAVDPNTLVITDSADTKNDFYQEFVDPAGRSRDSSNIMPIPLNNPFSGYVEGYPERTTNNPYGIENVFWRHNTMGYEFREGTWFQVDGNYDQIFSIGDFSHKIKTGFEFRQYSIQRHNQTRPNQPLESTTDVYSDKYPNIYLTDKSIESLYNTPKTPNSFGVFVQDQIRFKGLVITPGFRLDYFNSDSRARKISSLDVTEEEKILGFTPISEINNDTLFKDATAKYMFSPRFNITYPISEEPGESSNFSFNYGIYYKMPALNPIFDNFNLNKPTTGRVGDPDIEPEQTRTLQVAFEQEYNSEFYFKASAYFKDIYNELGVIAVKVAPTPFYLTAVTEYAFNRGIEFEVSKRLSDNYSFKLNYTLSSSKGTADGISSNFGLTPDRSIIDTTIYPFPVDLYPMNRDIRHQINMNLSFFLGKEEGPSIGGIYPFEDMTFGTQTNFRSGLPYTIVDDAGQEIGEKNSERGPIYWQTDLRINKKLRIGEMMEWFGEETTIDLYLDIQNVFNLRDAVGYYNSNRSPIYNVGIFRQNITNHSVDALYEKAIVSIPESSARSQYDLHGYRQYNSNADLDDNKLVTQDEKYAQTMKYYNDTQRFKQNFQVPIRVSFGLKLRF